MTILIGHIIKATANMSSLTAGRVANVYTFQVADPASQTQSNIKEAMARYVESVYIPLNTTLSDDMSYVDIDLFNVSLGTPEGSQPWPTLVAAANVGDLYAHGVAGVITATTGVKRTFGRKFFGGIQEGSVNEGFLTAAMLTSLATAAAAWIGVFTDGNGVILLPGVVNAIAPFIFSKFEEAFVRATPGYQRRRKPGVGE